MRASNLRAILSALTILGTVWTVITWIVDHDQRLDVQIISVTSLVSPQASGIPDLEVSRDGKRLKTPYITVIEIKNSGSTTLQRADFDSDLIIRIESGSIIERADVIAAKPTNLKPEFSISESDIKIRPLLLNSQDVLRFSVLSNGGKPSFSVTGRIAHISEIELGDKPIFDDDSVILSNRTAWMIVACGGFISFLFGVLQNGAIWLTAPSSRERSISLATAYMCMLCGMIPFSIFFFDHSNRPRVVEKFTNTAFFEFLFFFLLVAASGMLASEIVLKKYRPLSATSKEPT